MNNQSRAKHWAFTLNNYTPDDERRLSVLPAGCVYIVYGREIGEIGTPHLQGHLTYTNRVRFNEVRAFLSERAHLEVARNCSASILYCKKDGNFFEVGEVPRGAGSRNDLSEFKAAVKSGMFSLKEIREAHSDVYGRMPRFVLEYVADNLPLPELEMFPLRQWQQDLNEILRHEPDKRKIIFLVDLTGNTGKSWFCHYYARLHDNAQVLLPGKKADMAYALRNDIRVLFIDAPRSKQSDFLQYDFFEDVKNGYVFSTKYESRIKYLQKCHIVICMNEQPDLSKLSVDRYQIINL
jgi:hypothetical protein